MSIADAVIIGMLLVLAGIAGATLAAARMRTSSSPATEQLPEATEPCELCKAALGVTLVAVRLPHGPVWLELVCHGCAVEGVAAGRHVIVMPNARRVQP